MMIETTINGRTVSVDPSGTETAIDLIRDQLGLTGTKLACGTGGCGACTILVDGEPVTACLLPTTALDGAQVTTIEGLGPEPHPIQRALAACDGLQCGFCTPGFVMSAVAFYERRRAEGRIGRPHRDEVTAVLSGNLCRCGAQPGIIEAVSACGAGAVPADARPARVDAMDKLTGAALYTTDVRLPDMLHGVIVRSPVAHGVVTRLGLDQAVGTGGVAVDLLAEDRTVRFVGAPIAAFAAVSPDAARDAADRVELEIDERPAALVPGVDPPVFPDRRSRRFTANVSEAPALPAPWHGNGRGPNRRAWLGGTARRRVRTAVPNTLFTGSYTTASQSHTPLEPHATVASWGDDGLTVWTSTQAVGTVRDQIADRWDLPKERVRVVAEHVGGGFGSKLSMDETVVAAVELTRAAGRPVRVVLGRDEELTVGGHRPATRIEVAAVVDGGKLDAITFDAAGETGAAINSMIVTIPFLMYGRSPRSMHDRDLISHHPPGKPFRGPGGPPSMWALEQTVDDVAIALRMDPIDLRMRWDGNTKRNALYREAKALDLWRDRPLEPGTGRFRRGVGIAAGTWLYLIDPRASVHIEVEGGRVIARCGVQDIGTGTRTVIARAVEKELAGVAVDVVIGDSSLPHGPMSGGSQTSASVGPAAMTAAAAFREVAGERLEAELGGPVSVDASGVDHGGEHLPWPEVLPRLEGTTSQGKRPADRHGYFSPVTLNDIRVGRGLAGSVHVVEVEVDTLLGRLTVSRVWAGISAGRMWSPRTARSQVEGGVIQGIGYALYEERILDPLTGRTLTTDLDHFRIPGIADVPEIAVHFNEAGWDHVPGRGVGMAEVATLPVAAAIGNAVRSATGWRPHRLPIRPDRLLEGIES